MVTNPHDISFGLKTQNGGGDREDVRMIIDENEMYTTKCKY